MCSTEIEQERCQKVNLRAADTKVSVGCDNMSCISACWTNTNVLLQPAVTVTKNIFCEWSLFSSLCLSFINKWEVLRSVVCVIDGQTHEHLFTTHKNMVTVSLSFLQLVLGSWLHLAPPFPLCARQWPPDSWAVPGVKQSNNLEVKVRLEYLACSFSLYSHGVLLDKGVI